MVVFFVGSLGSFGVVLIFEMFGKDCIELVSRKKGGVWISLVSADFSQDLLSNRLSFS